MVIGQKIALRFRKSNTQDNIVVSQHEGINIQLDKFDKKSSEVKDGELWYCEVLKHFRYFTVVKAIDLVEGGQEIKIADLSQVAPPESSVSTNETKKEIFAPSKYQIAVTEFAKKGKGNAAINAVAGSGKSTTLKMILESLPKNKTILMAAFNRDIVEDLTEKVKHITNAEVTTWHSFGYRALRYQFKSEIDKQKYMTIAKMLFETIEIFDQEIDKFDYMIRCVRLCELARLNLANSSKEIERLAEINLVEILENECQIAYQLMEIGKKDITKIDYCDMLYLPIIHNVKVKTYDFVLCDECVSGDTILVTPNGNKKISDISIGEYVLSCDENHNKVYDKVVNKWNKGLKQTYRLLTDDGKFVDCTLNHKIFTNFGWLYISDIIEYMKIHTIYCYADVYQEYINHEKIYETADIGKHVGRCQHGLWRQEIKQISENENITFTKTNRLCEFKISNIERYSYNTTKDSRKWWIWKIIIQVYNTIFACNGKILQNLCVEWQKIGNNKLVEFIDYRRSSILVHGRWNWWKSIKNLYKFFFNRRTFVDSEIYERQMGTRFIDSRKLQTSLSIYESRKQKQILQDDKTLCDTIIRIQNKDTNCGENMRNMYNGIRNKYGAHKNVFEDVFERIETQTIEFDGISDESQGKKSKLCNTSKIVSIEKISIEQVYDIETEITHTFIANGVLVHNCQDQNNCQRELMKKAMKKLSGRFIAVGDPRQAIYLFAGSSSNSFYQILDIPNTIELPLSICYRCDAAIINEAKTLVPYIEARTGAPKGEINKDADITDIKDGDMVLCRNTAPLVKLCYKFLRQGVKAHVQGKDIGINLISLIKSTKKQDIGEMLDKLRLESEKILKNLMRKHGLLEKEAREHQTFESFLEKIDIIGILSESCDTVDDAIKNIQYIFEDKTKDGIRFSTIHRSKGLENDRVFLIQPNLLPSKRSMRSPELMKQEYNLQYVAITRAKHYYGVIGEDKFDNYKKAK